MKKILVVKSKLNKFCIDTDFVEGVYTEKERVREVLSELEPDDSIIEGLTADVFPVSLKKLLFGNDTSGSDEQHLIVLADNGIRFGLFVDSTALLSEEVAEEAFQGLPSAFSVLCRECFPEVVVMEDRAIPVMTPESIMKLVESHHKVRRKGKDVRNV